LIIREVKIRSSRRKKIVLVEGDDNLAGFCAGILPATFIPPMELRVPFGSATTR